MNLTGQIGVQPGVSLGSGIREDTELGDVIDELSTENTPVIAKDRRRSTHRLVAHVRSGFVKPRRRIDQVRAKLAELMDEVMDAAEVGAEVVTHWD
ncbi:hypothetical protein [Catenulispora yoronensis]|uniref:hypothetical protein n=1 Tax=Catenulispora yoronensis TaxID=450799 RepID=UPI0031D95029